MSRQLLHCRVKPHFRGPGSVRARIVLLLRNGTAVTCDPAAASQPWNPEAAVRQAQGFRHRSAALAGGAERADWSAGAKGSILMAVKAGEATARDYRLDFFRGCALVFIFIDHIPDNAVSYLTLRSFAFCDAAEVFIFISGYTAALVYSRAVDREGVAMGVARIYRRVWQLYVAHLCLFMIYNAEVAYTLKFFDNPLFADELQVADYLDDPGEAFIRVLTLQFQPSLLNILPLYIALLVALPVFLLALRRHPAFGLLLSAALYAAAIMLDFNMPGFPGDRHWYFNPFAWQFLFVIAACCGFMRTRGRELLPASRWLLWSALTFAIVAAVIQFSWTLHEVFPRVPLYIRLPDIWFDKTDLPPLRLVSLLALALIVAHYVPHNARFMTSRAGWLLVLTGQNSLYVFCLTILLDVLANFVLSIGDSAVALQLAVNLAGVVIIFGFGLTLAWFKAGGRLPMPPQGGMAA